MKSSNCLYCGKFFTTTKTIPKCCSVKCRGLLQRKPLRSCLVCGKSYRPNLPNQKYCSRPCSDSVIIRRSGTCLRCGQNYHPSSSKQTYCSRLCANTARHERTEKHCQQCGASIFGKRKQKYCSPKCQGLGRRSKSVYPEAEQWKLMRDEYLRLDWRLRAAIRKRKLDEQGWKCAYCDTPLAYRTHIDHRIPLRRGGTNDESNLCVACVRCNTRKGKLTAQEYIASLA